MGDGRRVLRDLRAGDRDIAPRGRLAHAHCRRRVRARAGRRHGVVREHAGGDHGLHHCALPVPGRGAVAIRTVPRDHRPGCRAGGCVLPLCHAAGSRGPVFRHQPRHGADAYFHLALLLGQPAGHDFRHHRVRECRRGTRPDRDRGRHPVAGPVGLLRTSRPGAPDRQEDSRCDQVAQGVAEFQQAEALRQQPGGDRGRLGRPCRRADRCHRQGEGHVDRASSHGWRLPEHRLRAEQVAAAFRQNAVLRRPREGIRLQERQRRVRLQRGDGAGAAHHQEDRAPRLGGALFRARRELHHGRCADHVAVQCSRRWPGDHHPQHRHRHGWRTVRSAHPRAGRSGLLHVGHDLGDSRVAVTSRRARGWPHRQRAGPGLPPVRRQRHHRAAGAASPDARRHGRDRADAAPVRRRGHPGSDQPPRRASSSGTTRRRWRCGAARGPTSTASGSGFRGGSPASS